jgi:hypothetical protein
LRAVNLACQSALVIVVEEEETEEDEDGSVEEEEFAFEPFKLASRTAAAEATRDTFASLVDSPGTALVIKVQSGLRASRTSLVEEEEEGEEDELDEDKLKPASSSPRATSDAAPSSSLTSSSVAEPRAARELAHSARTEDAVMSVVVGGGGSGGGGRCLERGRFWVVVEVLRKQMEKISCPLLLIADK